jgi:hypothetical protein
MWGIGCGEVRRRCAEGRASVAPVPRERWIGALTVRLTDANGTAIVHHMVQIDCSSEFRWPIGLAPGTYTLQMSAYGDGSATTTLVVGSAAQQVALQLVK